MPMLFTVKWPRLAQLEAAVLFPVVIAIVGEVIASRFDLDVVLMPTGSGMSLVALTAVVAVPFVGCLMVVDRILIVRKGFLMLACVATVAWACAAAALSDGVAEWMPSGFTLNLPWMSFRGLAALSAGTVAFLAHLKLLWIGLHDTGFAAMRMGVERRVDPASRIQLRRYGGGIDSSHREDGLDPSGLPEIIRGGKAMFRDLYEAGGFRVPAETVLALLLVAGWMYGSYRWIYSASHGAADRGQPASAAVANSTPLADAPVIDGDASTARDGTGRYIFDVLVNGTRMPMVYDDSVPLVTLRAEDALRIGISFGRLDFSDKIKVGKGSMDVAGITINSMTTGNITYRLVPGFVTRPGALDVSILGHSFLGRLATDRVQNNRMIFTGTR